MKHLFLILTLLGLFTACTQAKKEETEEVAVLDPLDPQNYLVNFSNKDLDKESVYLFTAAQIQGPPAPTGNALKSKLITMKRQEGVVKFFESDLGKLASDSIKTKTPLFTLPIVAALSTEEVTAVNFKGLNDVFIANSYYTSDYPEDNLAEVNLKIEESYVSEVRKIGNYMYVNQFVKARDLETGKFSQFQMKYTISKYNPNKDFVPKDSTLQEQIGFFENWPVTDLKTEKDHTYIFKFDHNKPITYHLSANIPSEWQKAVSDGVLYWNRVFGKDIVKVATLPDGVTVHDPGYNIVQWIKWDTAGFAYADMQADPLTGETLQAHVYMTSVFAIGGLKRAKEYLKEIEQKPEPRSRKIIMGLKGFSPLRTCQHDHRALKDLGQVISHLEGLNLRNQDEEDLFKRYAADYIREVVAHEIGHTLGLRHNFAGSIHTKVTASEFNQVFANYFLNDKLPTSPIVSTVMDYTPSKVAALSGAHIRLSNEPLAYDKQAIEWGYSDKAIHQMDKSIPFCTDSHAYEKKYLDCKIWDRFNNPIVNAAMEWRESGREMIYSMLNLYQGLLDKNSSAEAKELVLKSIRFSTKEKASLTIEKFKALLEMLESEAKFKEVTDGYYALDVQDIASYKSLLANYQTRKLKEEGELGQTLLASFVIGNDSKKTAYRAQLEKDFESIFARDYAGKISAEEELSIRESFKKFFVSFDLDLLMDFTQVMKDKKLAIYDVNFKNKLLAITEPVLFAKSPEVVNETPNFVLYDASFNYDNGKLSLREEMGKMFMTNFFPHKPVYLKQLELDRTSYVERHKKELEALLGEVELKDVADENLYEWIVGEKEIFSTLSDSLL
jgi:hypothetical protein